jgi:DNA polymerase III epsilon subunit-like protein
MQMGQYLGGWPETYVAFDVETQGLDVMSPTCLACQLGWCVVKDRAVLHAGEIVVDWTHPEAKLPQDWLAATLERTREALAKNNHSYHCSLDRMRDEGIPPREAFLAYRDLLDGWLREGAVLVGHNCWAFDRPLLARHFHTFVPAAPRLFEAGRVLDTGMIEKANMLGVEPPESYLHMPRSDWYALIYRDRRRVPWSLAKHCSERYDLPVAQAEAHDAGYDCRINALLVERMRHLACG